MGSGSKVYSGQQEKIASLANALGHPVRVAILELLASQSCCYHGDLSEELPIANSTLSQHLKVLKEAGLIKGEINPPKTKYCIDRDNYHQALELFSAFFNSALESGFTEDAIIICQ